jgi:Fe-S-cluster containining protein
LSPTDVHRFAEHFGISEAEFLERYTRTIEGGPALRDQNEAGDCVFLQNKQCTAYEGRPTQCRTFPWWLQHLRTPEEWAEASKRCEGINHPDAPRIDALEIETSCATYLENLIEQNFSL